MKNIIKIVITGGPCAGKTKSIDFLKQHFENQGRNVFIIPETSTEIMRIGFKWWNKSVPVNVYQNLIFKYQLEKENIVLDTIINSSIDNVVVLFDRGLLDGKAYMDYEDYNKMIKEYNLSYNDLYNRYDIVIYLQSVAIKYPELFSNENNELRKSNLLQAINFDNQVKNIWQYHKNFIEIESCISYENKKNIILEKIKRL